VYNLSCIMYHAEKEMAKRVIDNICDLVYFQKTYVKTIIEEAANYHDFIERIKYITEYIISIRISRYCYNCY